MCKFWKKPEQPAGLLTLDNVVKELEYDILIHENWAVMVVEQPEYALSMGDYDWHMKWIDIYKSAIYYLRSGNV